MNATVQEWLRKAEADYKTAQRENQATQDFNHDAVCFHAQPCIEKWMKALLIQLDVIPPKTHDLVQLDQLLAQRCKQWSCPVEELRFLSRAAVDFRYPGEEADAQEAAEAFAIATRLRQKLFAILPPSP